jgi:hypothetical protein
MTIRCDSSMRRSKERCKMPDGRRWRCTGECIDCICCLFKQDDGIEVHKVLKRGHSNGIMVQNERDCDDKQQG